MSRTVLVLGSFVADVAFRAPRLPAWGETLMGSVSRSAPAAKAPTRLWPPPAPARTSAHRKLGDDTFGELARKTWAQPKPSIPR